MSEFEVTQCGWLISKSLWQNDRTFLWAAVAGDWRSPRRSAQVSVKNKGVRSENPAQSARVGFVAGKAVRFPTYMMHDGVSEWAGSGRQVTDSRAKINKMFVSGWVRGPGIDDTHGELNGLRSPGSDDDSRIGCPAA